MTAAPSLRFSFRIVARVDAGIPVERRGGDTLEFIPITGGPVSGEIDGDVVPGGGDWCLVRADGTFDVGRAYAHEHDTTIDIYEVLT